MKTNVKKNVSFIVQLVVLFCLVFGVSVFLLHFVISKDVVNGPSMEPGLMDGDRLISVRHSSIKRNDIVIVYAPDAASKKYLKENNATAKEVVYTGSGLYLHNKKIPQKYHELYVKRVIGLPGDTVASKNDQLYVNGKIVPQNYINEQFANKEMKAYSYSQGDKFTYDFSLETLLSTHRKTVPANSYFVMGDNRYVSHDGRNVGFIKRGSIQSEVKLRYWPLSKIKTY